MPKEIDNVTLQIKENINLLINNGQLEEAKILVDEYKRMVSDDIEVYSIEAVISIMEGDFNEAKIIINNGLRIDSNNFDLNYNLAYLYEKNGEYLDALETYEKIVFNMEDNKQRQQIIEYLNKLEDIHRKAIQEQLEQRYKGTNEIDVNEKKRYLHLMYDSPYCEEIIRLVNNNFLSDEHQFIIIGKRNLDLKYIDINNVNNAEILDLEYDVSKLLYYIENCSKILIQYLFDVYCEIICRFNIKKPIYWFSWCGDIYNYIDFAMYDCMTKKILNQIGISANSTINKNSINYIYRKVAIRRINKIGITLKEDFKILKKNFITAGECIDYVFPNPVEYKKLNVFYEQNKYEFLKKKYKNIILVGNSANPSNNQVDILYKLKKVNKQSFCILMPLSYGGNQIYVNEIVKLGKKLFNERFIPLLEYINSNEYSKLLSIVDSAVMAHNRPQAAGNINALIYLGKKVFMKKDTSFYMHLNEIGVEIFNISDITNFESLFCKTKKIQEDNKIKIIQRFGNEATVEAMSRFLD